MEIIIGLVVVGVALYWFAFRKKPESLDTTYAPYKVETPSLDVNKDGQVNLEDAKAAVVKVADVNNDGKVDKADATEVVKKAKATTKKVATKAKATATKAKTAVSKAKKPKSA